MSPTPRPGRGRLFSIDLLPREVDDIVAWAADELGNRDRTQTDIYQEFVQRCEDRMAEFRGELEFEIPGLRLFNRHAMRLARMSRMLDETREIASVLAAKFDPQTHGTMTVLSYTSLKFGLRATLAFPSDVARATPHAQGSAQSKQGQR